mgnify:CR=1 FL=1
MIVSKIASKNNGVVMQILYNGGFLELTYLGTNYNNDPEMNTNQIIDLNYGK